MSSSMLGFALPDALPVLKSTQTRSPARILYLGIPEGVSHIHRFLNLMLWLPDIEVVSPIAYRLFTHSTSSCLLSNNTCYCLRIIRNFFRLSAGAVVGGGCISSCGVCHRALRLRRRANLNLYAVSCCLPTAIYHSDSDIVSASLCKPVGNRVASASFAVTKIPAGGMRFGATSDVCLEVKGCRRNTSGIICNDSYRQRLCIILYGCNRVLWRLGIVNDAFDVDHLRLAGGSFGNLDAKRVGDALQVSPTKVNFIFFPVVAQLYFLRAQRELFILEDALRQPTGLVARAFSCYLERDLFVALFAHYPKAHFFGTGKV